MMQITLSADYALRAVTYIATTDHERCVPAAEIAHEQEIPVTYVCKILQALSKAGILVTMPGRKGGTRLKRSPKCISILDIIEAVDGPLALNRCLIRRGQCSRDSFCPIHPFWLATRRMVADVMSETKISQFINSKSNRSKK